jgi:glutamyl-Q tRNA(Asp) synthetase
MEVVFAGTSALGATDTASTACASDGTDRCRKRQSEVTENYVGRFAPSPTGPLHFGSLVAALASYVDARSHSGTWLLRIEDVDRARCSRVHETTILHQLAHYGFAADGDVVRQSDRDEHYRNALNALQLRGLVYRCRCTRKMLENAPRNSDGEVIYPGTCRDKKIEPGESNAALRLNLNAIDDAELVEFEDRATGRVSQRVRDDVGDFVLHRADGDFAYQLAVVVDDALQGVTHIVRGADLLGNTPRQIVLQRLLDYPTPSYLHVPIAKNPNGEKLSKQTKAAALTDEPRKVVETLHAAWAFLQQTPLARGDLADFWRAAVANWQPERLQRLQSPQAAANL